MLALASVLAAFLLAAGTPQPAPLRVLFVGNSLTYQNDLPHMLGRVAQARGHDLQIDVHALGGYRLSQHAAAAPLLAKLDRGGWDVVVLQEQSLLPAIAEARLETEVFPFARELCQRVRAASPRAKIAFYQTMAKRNGEPGLFPDLAETRSYEGLQRRINAAYVAMAKRNRAMLVPVGQAFQAARAARPPLDLYADDTHPSVAGTYLAACVFFAVLFGESPVGLVHPSGVDDLTAARLQVITAATVGK